MKESYICLKFDHRIANNLWASAIVIITIGAKTE